MKKTVAISLSSESGDDYLFCLEGDPEYVCDVLKAQLGEEADYCHLKQVKVLHGLPADEYVKAIKEVIGGAI